MNHRLTLVPLLLAAPFAAAQEDQKAAPKDPLMAQARAISPEFAKAVARSRMHNTRLLLAFPAEGQDLAAALKKDRTLSRKLLYEVELFSLTGEHAAKMATRCGVAGVEPTAAMLSNDGEVLVRLTAEDLLDDGVVAGARVLKKIEPHFCPPVDAQKKLDDALAVAKKTGRNVFVRFDAPW